MDNEVITEIKPRLFKSGQILTVDSKINDPSVTIIEIGEKLGFLLSESFYDDDLGISVLENVTWCHYFIQKKVIKISGTFDKIELY